MAFDRVRNLRPVKRYRSERYVLISLVTFALSVSLWVNLLVFYEDQMKALILTAVEYVLLVAVYSCRRLYLEAEAEEAGRAGAAAQSRFAEALRAAAIEPGVVTRDAS
jgi:nitrogen fixation/metabolism regulation signal transduction histidine kinase